MIKLSMKFELVFIRHGESTGNVIKQIPSEEKDLLIELTETGKEQARTAKNILQYESFDAIFSSDMIRAKQTAEIIFENKEIIFNKELSETYVSKKENFVIDCESIPKSERIKMRLA